VFCKNPLDLHLAFSEVQQRGGAVQVECSLPIA